MSYSETVARISQLDPTMRRGGEWARLAPAAGVCIGRTIAPGDGAVPGTSHEPPRCIARGP